MRSSGRTEAGPSDPQLLIRRTDRGWDHLGSVRAHELLRIMIRGGISRALVVDRQEGETLGVIRIADVKYLVSHSSGPIRQEDVEWLAKGTLEWRSDAIDDRSPAVLMVERWPGAGEAEAVREERTGKRGQIRKSHLRVVR